MNPYKLKVTQGTGKMLGIPSINTSPLVNEFCIKQYYGKPGIETICKYCYSLIALKSFRSICCNSWAMNTTILSQQMIPLPQIEQYKGTFYRLHSHGELMNITHYKNFVNIAAKNEHITFLLYTKRPVLAKLWHDQCVTKPRNLVLVYSNPKINDIVTKIPPYFDKVFNVITSEIPLFDGVYIDCLGACAKCLKCFDIDGQTVIVEKIKSYSHRCLTDPVPREADPLPEFKVECEV